MTLHLESFQYAERMILHYGPFKRVLDVGSLDVNGTIKEAFGPAEYTGLDLSPGRNVDIVHDIVTWKTRSTFDCIITMSALEHYEDWPAMITKMRDLLAKERSLLIITTVTDPWPPHAAHGGPMHPEEFYANVDRVDLERLMAGLFEHWICEGDEHGNLFAAGWSGQPWGGSLAT